MGGAVVGSGEIKSKYFLDRRVVAMLLNSNKHANMPDD
jgi:hypothetical protein